MDAALPHDPVPRQLPARTPHFVGRRAELDRLDALVDDTADTVVVAAVHGPPGIGKTALALRWAHSARSRFPDGQLYVDLRGFDRDNPLTSSRALHGFLLALGVAPEVVPADPEAKAALYRSLLHGRRVLVVLDNARDSDQVRPLLPGDGGSAALITGRRRLDGLVAREGAHLLSLDLLTPDDAMALVERRVGADRVAREEGAATALVERCARLPLALSIAAARAAARPDAALAELLEELGGGNALLDALDLGEDGFDLRTVFSWSYEALPAPVQRTFRLLGSHRGPDFGDLAVASLIGEPLPRARAHLARLVSAHLVSEHRTNRFRVHDLLRLYAEEQGELEGAAARREAVHRLLDHYAHCAWSASRRLYAYAAVAQPAAARPGVVVRSFADYDDALRWFTTEHATLLATVQQAEAEGFDAHAWQLPSCLSTYFDRRGYWHDYLTTLRTASAAATRLGDRAMLAHSLRGLGRVHALLLDHDEALRCCLASLRMFEELRDDEGQARSHRMLAMIHQARGQHARAVAHGEQARRLSRLSGNRAGEARALHVLGWCRVESGEPGEALAHCLEAIRLFAGLPVPDTQGQASAVEGCAYALHSLGRHREAITHYRHAIELWRQLGNRFYEAGALTRLGASLRHDGHPAEARRAWARAHRILVDMNHPDASSVEAELTGPAGLVGDPAS